MPSYNFQALLQTAQLEVARWQNEAKSQRVLAICSGHCCQFAQASDSKIPPLSIWLMLSGKVAIGAVLGR